MSFLRSDAAPTSALILTTIIWGSTFVITKDLMTEWTPLAYLAMRFALATIVLVALFPSALRKLGSEEWQAGVVLGVLIGGGMLLQTAGQVYTTASKSAFITSLATPLVPVLGFALGRARPSGRNLAGVAVAFLGGLLMLLPGAAANAEPIAATTGGINTGDLLTLGCTIFFATHITLMETYAQRFELRRLTLLQIGAAAALLGIAWAGVHIAAGVWTAEALPVFIAREAGTLSWSAGAAWQFAYLVFAGTVAAFLLWTWGQRRVSAVRAAIIFTLEPVFATLFAVAVHGREEWLGGWSLLGAGLIVAGVLVSEVGGQKTEVRGRRSEVGKEAGK